ncbi:hypothetical protein P376_1899 [Streptomyces sp. HCCB10043]|nr:hypothetical protein P376_1899 [Streptomyces sp. HCCB10043]
MAGGRRPSRLLREWRHETQHAVILPARSSRSVPISVERL